jgi:hypothetical protein
MGEPGARLRRLGHGRRRPAGVPAESEDLVGRHGVDRLPQRVTGAVVYTRSLIISFAVSVR